MELTAEQTAAIRTQVDAQRENENARREHEVRLDKRRTKLELLRMARDVLVESARHKPAEEAAVSPAQITAFAEELNQYIGD